MHEPHRWQGGPLARKEARLTATVALVALPLWRANDWLIGQQINQQSLGLTPEQKSSHSTSSIAGLNLKGMPHQIAEWHLDAAR
jgi:hypothetical protein